MEDEIHRQINMLDRSYSGVVKKAIREHATQIGFRSSGLGEVELIVSELVSNAIKYANGVCYFLFKSILDGDVPGIEIIYTDNGPGMENAARMLKDGNTTSADSAGEGLGAIFRQSDFFDMYSRPNNGTVILSRKYLKNTTNSLADTLPEITRGVLRVAAPGEQYCGDNWYCIKEEKAFKMLIIDGLGHGKKAHEVSDEAVKFYKKIFRLSIKEQLEELHRRLKNTRGAVCLIYSADYGNNEVTFCGIGNISAKVVAENKVSNCTSHNGIVGYTIPSTFHENTMSWNDRDLLIAHSDGINTRWNLKDYPGIEKHHPLLIAAFLYKNHNRGRDDVVIVILKRYKKPAYPFTFMVRS